MKKCHLLRQFPQWLINLAWIVAIVGALAYGSFKSYELSQTHHAYRLSLQAIGDSHAIDDNMALADQIRMFLDERPEKYGDVLAFAAELRAKSGKIETPVPDRQDDE